MKAPFLVPTSTRTPVTAVLLFWVATTVVARDGPKSTCRGPVAPGGAARPTAPRRRPSRGDVFGVQAPRDVRRVRALDDRTAVREQRELGRLALGDERGAHHERVALDPAVAAQAARDRV